MNDFSFMIDQILNFTINPDTSQVHTVRFEDIIGLNGEPKYPLNFTEEVQ